MVLKSAAILMAEPLSTFGAKQRTEMRDEVTSLQPRLGSPWLVHGGSGVGRLWPLSDTQIGLQAPGR
jgi:hypothetical protein